MQMVFTDSRFVLMISCILILACLILWMELMINELSVISLNIVKAQDLCVRALGLNT